MPKFLKHIRYARIFGWALFITAGLVMLKWLLHHYGIEPIAQTSLHNSVVSSVIFVIGFLMSATIADYKESEKIPAEFAALTEDMYEDAKSIHKTYPDFDLNQLRKHLIDILHTFRDGTRNKRYDARKEIRDLHEIFNQMERAGVPANFVVKLKQQQTQMLRSLYRINYIQKIKFIPSATLLARSIVVLVIGMLMLTNIDPFYGGLTLTGIISFILIYMLLLIRVIGVPFHSAGRTRDDVSLFLIHETKSYLMSEPLAEAKSKTKSKSK